MLLFLRFPRSGPEHLEQQSGARPHKLAELVHALDVSRRFKKSDRTKELHIETATVYLKSGSVVRIC